jgi:hypothetical protein
MCRPRAPRWRCTLPVKDVRYMGAHSPRTKPLRQWHHPGSTYKWALNDYDI